MSSTCYPGQESCRHQKLDRTISCGDGMDTILKALHNHGAVQGVQQRVCALLMILADKNDGNRVSIAQHGGIDSILAANHRCVVCVQKEACGALLNLSVNDGNRKLIAAKGGINDIVSTMLDLPQVNVVQLYGCSTLSILALGNTDTKNPS